MFADMRQKLYTHGHQKRGRRGLRLCEEEGGPLRGAWLDPRRNGNRFDHKQTVAYLGHWAALGEPPIECRAWGSVQHADLSSVFNPPVCGTVMWERTANFAYRLRSCTVRFISRIDRARESRAPSRFLRKYAKNGYTRMCIVQIREWYLCLVQCPLQHSSVWFRQTHATIVLYKRERNIN